MSYEERRSEVEEKMKIKDILGIILGIVAVFTIASMMVAMSSGNTGQGGEILVGAATPWWINPLVALSASSVGVIIVVLIILFKDKILNIRIN